jgi:hypothetical protein
MWVQETVYSSLYTPLQRNSKRPDLPAWCCNFTGWIYFNFQYVFILSLAILSAKLWHFVNIYDMTVYIIKCKKCHFLPCYIYLWKKNLDVLFVYIQNHINAQIYFGYYFHILDLMQNFTLQKETCTKS